MKITKQMIKVHLIAIIAIASTVIVQPLSFAGEAISFDGTDDRIAIEGIDLRNTSFTVEFWAKAGSVENEPLLTQGEAAKDQSLHVRFQDGWGITKAVIFSFYGDDLVIENLLSRDADLWHHWAFVYDQENHRKLIYQDGINKGQQNNSGAYLGAGVLYPGFNPWMDPLHQFYKGAMDELRIWKTARTADEINANMKTVIPEGAPNLMARYDFSESSGTAVFDRSLSGYNGTAVNTDASARIADTPMPKNPAVSEKPNRVMVFDVDSDYIKTGNIALAGQSFTIEFWAKKNEVYPHYGFYISHGTLNAEHGSLQIGFWQTRYFFAFDGENMLSPEAYLTDTNWHHLACVYDAGKNERRMMADGNLIGSDTPAAPYAGNGPLYIGRLFETSNLSYHTVNSRMDEVRVWNIARTREDILLTMNRTIPEGTPGLIGRWDFEESSGYTAFDRSCQGHNGAVLGNTFRAEEEPRIFPGTGLTSLSIDGTDDDVKTGITNLGGAEITVEYWFKGTVLQSPVSQQSDRGYITSAKSVNGVLTHVISDNTVISSVRAVPDGVSITDGNWHHLAFTWKRGAAQGFVSYLDGELVAQTAAGDMPIPDIGAELHIGGASQGQIDDVRIWNVARTQEEINASRRMNIPPDTDGLTARYDFSEASGDAVYDRSGNGNHGIILNGAARIAGTPMAAPNPTAAGLWTGQIEITKVNEVRGSTGSPKPVDSPFNMEIILHADTAGQVRLLREVTLMRKTSEDRQTVIRNVLVTDDSLIPKFEGVSVRNGKLVGNRIGSLFFDFDPEKNELPLQGGIGPANLVSGRLEIAADHPTNPFRHKFHPDHKTGMVIVREIALVFDDIPQTGAPGDGISNLKGTYREVIRGLHKIPLIAEGSFRLDKISNIKTLNNQ